jgi:hypothetical protein
MSIRLINTPDGFVDPESLQANTMGVAPTEVPITRPAIGTLTLTHRGGQTEMSASGTTRYQHSSGGTAGGSIMATLSATHGPATVELEPGNPASRTVLQTAVREGLIKSDGRGGWQDVTNDHGQQRTIATVATEAAQQAQQIEAQQAREQRQATEGVFVPEEDAQWQAEMADVPDPAFRSTMALVTNAVVLGQSLDAAAARLSQETGMDPDAAMQKVITAGGLQQRIVDRALGKLGLEGEALEAFYTEATNEPARLQNAIHHLMHARDVRPFQQMGREFVEKVLRLQGQYA